ncbi:MAG: hypothetical protein V4525_12765 [Pseudomonadota bacterium]
MQKRTTKPLDKICAPFRGSKLWFLLATTATALTFSPYANALGLGSYQVRSALGQPLKLAIDILATTKGSISASCFNVVKDTYTSIDGIPYVIQGSLSVEPKAKGKPARLIFVASRPTNDPILKINIESTCGQRARRELTVMLDPQLPTDGKNIPLPLAPSSTGSSTAAEAAAVLPAANVNSMNEPGSNRYSKHTAPAPSNTKNTKKSAPIKAAPKTAPQPAAAASTPQSTTGATGTNGDATALPGSLTPSELEAYEKAIHSPKSKSGKGKHTAKNVSDAAATSDQETSNEKKKSSTTLSKALTLQPQKLATDDGSDLRLSVSNSEGGAAKAPKSRIQPKLNMITEIDQLNDTSPGNTSEPTSTLSAEERAAILAKVERVVNAPLEHDLPKDGLPSDANNTNADKTPSAYERYITQQTKDEMEKKLAATAGTSSKKSYRTAAWFAGASLFLLGFWFWRKRNVERSRSYLANVENVEKKKYPKKLEPLLNQDQDIKSTWSENNLTKEYPGTQTHTVTFEYEPGTAAPDTLTSSPAPSHSAAPTSAFVSREDTEPSTSETTDGLKYKHEEDDSAPAPSSTADSFLNTLHDDEHDASSTSSKPDVSKANPSLEKKSDQTFMPENKAPALSEHTLQSVTPVHVPDVTHEEETIATPSMAADIDLNTTAHEHALNVPASDPIKHSEEAIEKPESPLLRGQTVVEQATEYLHSDQISVATSYLESSIEWLPSAPQPWLLLLKIHAQDGNTEAFETLQLKFFDVFKSVAGFNEDDLLNEPELSEENHHAALEQCAPDLLASIMNDWDQPTKALERLEDVLLNQIQSSLHRFTIKAIQELLFLYTLAVEKNSQE